MMKGNNMKKKRNKMDPIGNFVRYGSSSAKWTALFSLLAIFSILTMSIAQVSFAIGTDYPEQLTQSSMDTEMQLKDSSKQYAIPNGGIKPKYAMANGKKVPVYCLEIWAEFPTSAYPKTFDKTSEQTYMTPGVAALLTYADSVEGPFGKVLSDTPDSNKAEQASVQLALWLYLYTKNVNDYQNKVAQVHKAGGTAAQFYMDSTSEAKIYSYPVYGAKIKQLVQFARDHEGDFNSPSVGVSTENPSWSTEGDYKVSEGITLNISPIETLESFNITINDDVPEGTVILVGDEEFTKDQLGENKSFTKADASKTIKIKVPISQITNTKGNISLGVTTRHMKYNGWEYKTDNGSTQKIASGKPVPESADHQINVTIEEKVEVPETAQNSSVALYIIGLIVLLCGIGIVYANVNPTKQK